jgi:hypothetical protein
MPRNNLTILVSVVTIMVATSIDYRRTFYSIDFVYDRRVVLANIDPSQHDS